MNLEAISYWSDPKDREGQKQMYAKEEIPNGGTISNQDKL